MLNFLRNWVLTLHLWTVFLESRILLLHDNKFWWCCINWHAVLGHAKPPTLHSLRCVFRAARFLKLQIYLDGQLLGLKSTKLLSARILVFNMQSCLTMSSTGRFTHWFKVQVQHISSFCWSPEEVGSLDAGFQNYCIKFKLCPDVRINSMAIMISLP